MAVESFLINTGLSIIGSWLFPKKKEKTTPEDVPALGQGADIYFGWGIFLVPGNLLYATPASIAGHGDDRSTFGVLGIANPHTDCDLLAIRVNNVLAATKSPLFPITDPVNPGVVQQNGLTTKKELNFFAQNSSNVPNDNFAKNGYSGLQYSGLTWVGFYSSDRQKYGGFNSRVSLVYSNKATTNSLVPFTVKGDDTVTVNIGISYGNSKNSWGRWFNKTFQHGFFGVYNIFCYSANLSVGVMAVGGLTEINLSLGNPDVDTAPFNDPKFAIGSISPDVLPTTAGNLTPVFRPTYTQPLTSNNIVLVVEGKTPFSIDLPNSYPLPFRSNAGFVYDALDNPIYNSPIPGVHLIGWDNSYFYYQFFDSENTSYLEPGFSVPSGTVNSSKSKLSTIIYDLLKEKGAFQYGKQFIDESTEQIVRGFSTTLTSIPDIIINLCTCYAKFVFQDGEGDYWLIDYPLESPVESFEYGDFLTEPKFKSSNETQQPDQINYSYKSFNNEFTEKQIHIGNSNNNGNATELKTNLIQTESEAKQSAWNVLFLRSQTNLSLNFRTIKKIPRAGLVISVMGKNYLVANITIGADLSFEYTCVNYVPVRDFYTDYMIASSIKTNQVSNSIVESFFIPTENIISVDSQFKAGLVYTNNANPVIFHKDNGDITAIRTIIPVTGGFIGVLTSYQHNKLEIERKEGVTLDPLPSGLLRIGLSWVKYTGFSKIDDKFTFTNFEIGAYSSSDTIRNGDYVAQINQNNYGVGYENTGNVILSEINQAGKTISLKSYPTTLAGNNIIPSFGQVTVNYPYGYPCSGILVAKASSSNFAGFTHLWISKPGGHQDFIFDEPVDFQEAFNYKFYTKQGVFNYTYLGDISTGYTVLSSTLNTGAYQLFQANLNFAVTQSRFSKGSFQWNCIAI